MGHGLRHGSFTDVIGAWFARYDFMDRRTLYHLGMNEQILSAQKLVFFETSCLKIQIKIREMYLWYLSVLYESDEVILQGE
ncbi:hypothetical protein CsSME_00048859 [Camellia sinensis var. sinensis]